VSAGDEFHWSFERGRVEAARRIERVDDWREGRA
jgi:hypothetical protein